MRQKEAFSLIEVLLVMGIIAVVTTMGISASKRSVDKAYNYYWYTGYSTLCDATMDAVLNKKLDTTNPPNTLNIDVYAQYIGKTLMNATTYTYSNNKADFTAPNGIRYEIQNVNNQYLKITMTIPKPNRKKNFPNKTVLVYNFAPNVDMIYPANIANSTTQISLHNRADLLPFGVKSTLGNSTISNFYGFKDAYCKVYSSITGMSEANVACTTSPSEQGSVVIPLNPRKIY